MKSLSINNLVKNTSTNEEGIILFNVLNNAFLNNELLIISLDSISSLSSSFLNTSIGEFMDIYGYENLKKTLKIKGTKSQFEKINIYISKYKELQLVN
jgi:hypothetical protein